MSKFHEDDEPSTEETTEELKKRRSQQSFAKIQLVKRLRTLTKYDGEWDIRQQLFQEIIATKLLENENAKIPTASFDYFKDYKIIIKERYGNPNTEEEKEIYELLQECIPSIQAFFNWTKLKGWDEAVWARIRDVNLFSKHRRASMIDSLYQRGMNKDTAAAKIWLQLSGDLVEKTEIQDTTFDKYKEINKILHKKN